MALSIHGRFFHLDGERTFLRAVTYGPFPPGKAPEARTEIPRIAAAGFHVVRTYETPDREFLDLLSSHGLTLITTIPWHWDSLFTENPITLSEAQDKLTSFLKKYGQHPALGALLIANEIRPDLVRFMGPLAVRNTLEELITHCRKSSPHLPIGYANFPTTEYLEPRNADFSAFNVYLENQNDFRRYLRRLHNIAGDRPLLLTEFGFNTQSPNADENLEEEQAQTLSWALQTAYEEALSGFTTYAWTDLWYTGGAEVTDWSFGLTRRDGSAKPSLQALQHCQTNGEDRNPSAEKISVAICTRNGGHRLLDNLPYFEKIEDKNFELLVIDDGSTDDTREIVSEFQKHSSLDLALIPQKPSGLSAARNHAAREGKGAIIAYIDDDARPHPLWLSYLRKAYADNPNAMAAGGPNIPPHPISRQNAIVTASAGNASHILFSDTTAEHLAGCNLSLRRKFLLDLGGFDERYHAAGDDVDVCWRILDSGHDLAFHPAACVFHDRRPTIKGFIRQQMGYGEAEALLYQKHPNRFGADGIRWEGFIYSGGPLSPDKYSIIYHGPMGEAPFQMLSLRHMPIRPLPEGFDNAVNRLLVKVTNQLTSFFRRRARRQHGGPVAPQMPDQEKSVNKNLLQSRKDYPVKESNTRLKVLEALQEQGWKVSSDEAEADLEKGSFKIITAQTPLNGKGALLHVRLLHPPVATEPFWEKIEQIIH